MVVVGHALDSFSFTSDIILASRTPREGVTKGAVVFTIYLVVLDDVLKISFDLFFNPMIGHRRRRTDSSDDVLFLVWNVDRTGPYRIGRPAKKIERMCKASSHSSVPDRRDNKWLERSRMPNDCSE